MDVIKKLRNTCLDWEMKLFMVKIIQHGIQSSNTVEVVVHTSKQTVSLYKSDVGSSFFKENHQVLVDKIQVNDVWV